MDNADTTIVADNGCPIDCSDTAELKVRTIIARSEGEKKYDGDHVVDLYMRNQEGAITIPEGTNLRAATPNRAPTGKIDKTYGGASFRRYERIKP